MHIAKTMLCFNRLFGRSIKVIVNGRSREKIEAAYGELPVHKLIGDVCDSISTEMPVDYIIHCASITSSQAFVKTPVDTIRTALNGTSNLLELAKDKNVSGFLYTSSLEVYGVPNKFNVKEDDYGYIDILNARSSYSEGKRMAECM
jgi:nucleoside-diphosphate-sugar epimerase